MRHGLFFYSNDTDGDDSVLHAMTALRTTCVYCSIQSQYKMHKSPSDRFLSEHRTPLFLPLTHRDASVLSLPLPLNKSCSPPPRFATQKLEKTSTTNQSNLDTNCGLKRYVALLLLSVDLLNLIALEQTQTHRYILILHTT